LRYFPHLLTGVRGYQDWYIIKLQVPNLTSSAITKNLMTGNLETFLKNLPSDSGVYFMKDKEGNIIYTGRLRETLDIIK
jgi:hypothetical protein